MRSVTSVAAGSPSASWNSAAATMGAPSTGSCRWERRVEVCGRLIRVQSEAQSRRSPPEQAEGSPVQLPAAGGAAAAAHAQTNGRPHAPAGAHFHNQQAPTSTMYLFASA